MTNVLSGRVNSQGEEIGGVLFHNPTLMEMMWNRVGHNITGTSNVGLFNSDLPPRWYIADNTGLKYAVSMTGRNTINIAVYNPDGTESTSDLSHCLFEIFL